MGRLKNQTTTNHYFMREDHIDRMKIGTPEDNIDFDDDFQNFLIDEEIKNGPPPKPKRGRKAIPIPSDVSTRVIELRSLGLSYEKIVKQVELMGHEITVYRVKKIVATN